METYPKYIEQYPLSDIVLNDWNPNRMDEQKFKSLVRSIVKRKFIVPIVINKDGVVVDGEHRYLASKECGLENVSVVQVNMSQDEMKLSTLGLNAIQGENAPLEFARLLQDLNQRYSLEEIAELIGLGAETIKDKLELLKIPDGLVERLREDAEEKEKSLPVLLSFVMDKEQYERVMEVLEMREERNRTERLLAVCEAYARQKSLEVSGEVKS